MSKKEDDSRALSQGLSKRAKKKREKEKFIRTRMWVSTFLSKFFTDRGTIPDNIGNNILVSNNVCITKNSITSYILVIECAECTPVCWTSEIVQHVKEQVEGVRIDIIMKGNRYYPDLSPSGTSSREKSWTMTLNNPMMPKDAVRRSARCLYSLDVARSGEKLYKFRTYIRVRANSNTTLRQAISLCEQYLTKKCDAKYKVIKSNLEETLAYTTLMSDAKPEHLKDIPPMIFSLQTLAESLPSIQGMNNFKGVVFGFDTKSNYPYLVDIRSSSSMKNVLLEADSGFGKTFLVEWWLYPFYADDFNLCIMDIKGTEFAAITKALHGVTLSMRNSSTLYINTWAWRKEECFDDDYMTYVNERMRLSKEQIMLMADLEDRLRPQGEALAEEFIQSLYRSIGAIRNNVNTWKRTEKLTPYAVTEYFNRFVSHEIRDKYPKVAELMLERVNIYMSRTGSSGHMYRDEYHYIDVLENRVLTFDFGILEASSAQDPVMFRIHVLFMQVVNDAFVSYKKSRGEWTVKVLEESQIVDDYLTKIYTREMTLRRAQNQVTVLLGNSVSALAQNPASRPMLENINIMCLGKLNKSSRNFLIEEYGLTDLHEDELERIQTDSTLTHTFLLINRLEKDATTALLTAPVPDDVRDSELFKVVDTKED